MSLTLRQCLLAEVLGTAILLIFGTGAAVVEEQTHALGHGGVAAAFGLVLVILRVTAGPMEVGRLAGLAISATVGLEALVAGPLPLTRPAQRRLDQWVALYAGAAGRRAAGRGGGRGLAATNAGCSC